MNLTGVWEDEDTGDVSATHDGEFLFIRGVEVDIHYFGDGEIELLLGTNIMRGNILCDDLQIEFQDGTVWNKVSVPTVITMWCKVKALYTVDDIYYAACVIDILEDGKYQIEWASTSDEETLKKRTRVESYSDKF